MSAPTTVCKVRKTGNKYELVFYTPKGIDVNKLGREPLPTDPVQLSFDDLDSLRNYEDEALNRAKRKVIEYGENNQWTHFATFTFDICKIDRDDRELILERFRNAFKNYRKRVDGLFRFLIVPEWHSDKQHIHFHGLVYLSELNTDTLTKRYDKKNKQVFFISQYFFDRFGANRLESIRTTAEYSVYYATKYMTKDTAKIFSCSYFCSRGLDTATDIAVYGEPADLKHVLAVLNGFNTFGLAVECVADSKWAKVYSLDETTYNALFPTN
jgi:hypothetical protein